MRTQIENVSTGHFSNLKNGHHLTISYPFPLGMSPQVIHRIQFRRGFGQEPELNIKRLSQSLAVTRGMLLGSIFKQDNVPASPMASDHLEKFLRFNLRPNGTMPEKNISRLNVERPMQDASPMSPTDKNPSLFANSTIAVSERRRF